MIILHKTASSLKGLLLAFFVTFICLPALHAAEIPVIPTTNSPTRKDPKAYSIIEPVKPEGAILKLITAATADLFVDKSGRIVSGSRHRKGKVNSVWVTACPVVAQQNAHPSKNDKDGFVVFCNVFPISAVSPVPWVECRGKFAIKGGPGKGKVELPTWVSELNGHSNRSIVILAHFYPGHDDVPDSRPTDFEGNPINELPLISFNQNIEKSAVTLKQSLGKDGVKVYLYGIGLSKPGFTSVKNFTALKQQLAADDVQNIREIHSLGHGLKLDLDGGKVGESSMQLIKIARDDNLLDVLAPPNNDSIAIEKLKHEYANYFSFADFFEAFKLRLGLGVGVYLDHCYTADPYNYWNGELNVQKFKIIQSSLVAIALDAAPNDNINGHRVDRVSGFLGCVEFRSIYTEKDGVWTESTNVPRGNIIIKER